MQSHAHQPPGRGAHDAHPLPLSTGAYGGYGVYGYYGSFLGVYGQYGGDLLDLDEEELVIAEVRERGACAL